LLVEPTIAPAVRIASERPFCAPVRAIGCLDTCSARAGDLAERRLGVAEGVAQTGWARACYRHCQQAQRNEELRQGAQAGERVYVQIALTSHPLQWVL